ncbi:hypothetical protein AMECASPLE_030983, partial [Ameca splendens]
QQTAKPAKTPQTAPAGPAHQSTRGIHAPAGYLGHAGQLLQAKHNLPAIPVQSQDMLRHPTHPTANCSRRPTMGQNHRRKQWKKVLGFNSQPERFCMEFACSPHA